MKALVRIVMFVAAVVVAIISTLMTRASVEMLPNMAAFVGWLLFWSGSLFYAMFYALEEVYGAIVWWIEEVTRFYADYNHDRHVQAINATLVDVESFEDFDLEVPEDDFPFTTWVEEEGEIYLCK